MSWTSDEQKMLEWATREMTIVNKNVVLSQIDKKEKSYWISRSQEGGIKEYDFDTMPEFKEKLNVIWDRNEKFHDMCRISAVSAMKEKPSVEQLNSTIFEHSNEEKNDFEIPEYVYMF